MPKANPKEDDQQTNEIVWTIQRLAVLFKYWTMPLPTDSSPQKDAKDETVSARSYALVIIAALTFAVRGDIAGSKVSFTVIAAALAAALSFILHVLSKSVHVTIRAAALTSAYASTILLMLAFVFVRSFFWDTNWYQDRWIGDLLGEPYAGAMTGAVAVFVLLCLKAVLWDKHAVSFKSAISGLGIVACSGGIVCVIYLMTNEEFQQAIDWLLRFFGSRK